MTLYTRWLALIVLALSASLATAAPASALQVRLSATSPVLRGDVDVIVTVEVINTSRHPVNLLRWQLPGDELEGALFRITRDGERVAYTGPLIKRAAPAPADRLRLEAGATLRYEVELTGAYDLSRNGRYAVEFLSRGHHGASAWEAGSLRSDPLYLWLESRSAKASIDKKTTPPPPGPGLNYAGNCSASQQTMLQTAFAAAQVYAEGAAAYYPSSTIPSATARYTTWFGSVTNVRWATAAVQFTAIRNAFASQRVTLDCKCRKPSIYAYVYPDQPYTIYLCGAFWSAPVTGTDSRAGTLIHEMSHFNAVAGTDDWVYGQAGAMALAVTDPDKALNNADSHEYFAENTPAQP